MGLTNYRSLIPPRTGAPGIQLQKVRRKTASSLSPWYMRGFARLPLIRAVYSRPEHDEYWGQLWSVGVGIPSLNWCAMADSGADPHGKRSSVVALSCWE